ncbi:MAG: carboxypeptidase regulatory-like domain-containing protein [Acidobacteria bacterium]|nr:carboxypeptidase regulatory-like domain-containing protein [Acidobacteriota bacterium]
MAKRYFTARTVLGSLAMCLTLVLAFVLSQHSGAQTARFDDDDKQLAPQAGTYSGRVFQDFNQNGLYDTSGGTAAAPTAVDVGVQGVTVTLYDAAGTARGNATSAADGTYSIASTGTGPYRIEFTTIPTGYSPSARSRTSGSGSALPTSTTNAGATVQFVPNNGSTNVNLALNRAADYCSDNPELCSQLYHFGDEVAPNAVFSIPYQNSGSTRLTGGDPVDDFAAPAGTNLATTAQVGTTFGLAYHRATRRVFAAAFFKKHSMFGPAGTGAIYQIDRGTGTVSTFVDLNAIFGANTAGANPHDTSDYDFDNGVNTWRAAGKVAFGGIALNADESYLFAMNLANRRLYRIPTSGPLNNTTIQSVAFPTSMGSGSEVCGDADDIRPFAVSYHEGLIYVGAVCSNESRSGQNNADARRNAYVYTLDPVALTFNATPAIDELSLNYTRAQTDPGYSANWNNWRANFTNIGNPTYHVLYPQAMLTDIDFDRGNMILSFRDRVGEQSGYNAASDPSDSSDHNRKGITAGEILRLCGNPTNGWTLESNGRCGGTGSAPQNTNEGPGGGEFYYQENYHPNGTPHDEVGLGSAAQIPGHNEMVAGIFDPPYIPNDNIYDAAGFRWFQNTGASAGSQNRGYMAYRSGTANFGKANGIGNVLPLCDAAPIELGNRVWRDSNNNGVQDPGEPGIAGVQVHLYDANNVLVGTAITDANGEYYFVSSTVADPNQNDNIGQVNGGIKFNSNYTIKLDRAADYNTGGPLFGLRKTTMDQTTQNGFDEGSDSDGDYDASGNYLAIPLTTGNPGDNNHNYDFGFVLAPSAAPVSVTGRITTANGNGIRNVRVVLTEENGTMHYAITGSFGYFVFENIESGQGVVVSVSAKRYTFSQPSRFISLEDNISDADWVSEQ